MLPSSVRTSREDALPENMHPLAVLSLTDRSFMDLGGRPDAFWTPVFRKANFRGYPYEWLCILTEILRVSSTLPPSA